MSMIPDSPVAVIKPEFSFATNRPLVIGLGISFALVGILTGWLISGRPGLPTKSASGVVAVKSSDNSEAGVNDDSTFKDTAEGMLEEGGINGEGQYHLVRPGGASQNVYLTSTVVDLKGFVGSKVKVWGQTLSAKKAGWLMDVGKVKKI